MKKKDLDKYNDDYGHIPKDYYERFKYLLSVVQLSNSNIKELREKINSFIKTKWSTEKYCIYFLPKATPRPRLSGRTKTFYVSDAKINNDTFKKFCKEIQKEELIVTPCKILIETYHPMPKLSKINTILAELKFIRPVSKPDWDNLGKTYSDMIQNNLIIDDSLIIDGRTVKYYSIKPRIEITLEYMDKHDSNYNKKKIESWGVYEKNYNKVKEKDCI